MPYLEESVLLLLDMKVTVISTGGRKYRLVMKLYSTIVNSGVLLDN